MPGLIELHGSKKAFETKLGGFFSYMYLNGEKMDHYFLDHKTIMKGGEWRVVLK